MNGFRVRVDPADRPVQRGYAPPTVRDLGTLADVTQDKGILLDITRATVRFAAMSGPLIPTDTGGSHNTTVPSGGGVLSDSTTSVPTSTTGTDTVSVLGSSGSGGSTDPSSVAGTAGSGSGGGGGTGSLPFTGLAIMGIAAVGAAASATGAALRGALRRGDDPA